jgi:hypothetical protein
MNPNTLQTSIPRHIHINKSLHTHCNDNSNNFIPLNTTNPNKNIDPNPITSNKQIVLFQLSIIMNEIKIKCNTSILTQQLNIIINEIRNSSEF